MERLFVDTSAWFSACDRNDGHHALVEAVLRENPLPLVTSNLVFAETTSLLTKRLGKPVACQFGQRLRASRRLQIVHVDLRLEERAWEAFAEFRDKSWDLIDCASFVLMDSMGIRTAFTLDRHFVQRGFSVLP